MTLNTTPYFPPTLQGQLLKLYTEVPNPDLRRRIAQSLAKIYFAPNQSKDPNGERVYYIENCYWFTLPALQATTDET